MKTILNEGHDHMYAINEWLIFITFIVLSSLKTKMSFLPEAYLPLSK